MRAEIALKILGFWIGLAAFRMVLVACIDVGWFLIIMAFIAFVGSVSWAIYTLIVDEFNRP